MEISLKRVIAIALAGAAALGSMTASADIVTSASGNGELTLYVRNDLTGVTYARGLQIFVDNVLAQAAIQGPYTAPSQPVAYSLPSIAADSNLTAFLGQPGTFSWTIMGGDNTGGNATIGNKRYVTTTQTDLSGGTSVTNTNLGSSYNTYVTMEGNVNAALPDAPGSSTQSGGQWREGANQAGDWWGVGPNTVNALGSSANFYMLANGGVSGAARVYEFADVTLSLAGALSSGGGPAPVPLPAAVWLLGSGLIGLAGIGRRRRVVAKA